MNPRLGRPWLKCDIVKVITFAQYTLVPGDTLSAIAEQWYGDSSVWSRIFEANRDQIGNPDLIFPGQVLRIPQ